MKSKYIVYEDCMIEHAIIFDFTINHSDIAHALRVTQNVLGAGFVNVGIDLDGKLYAEAYGKSISLGVCSRAEDNKAIRRSLGLV